ncbi:MAG: H-NS histone family protein [Proteobacteria bacterium]|nr:H-NS histone family protein [Pseudomonadota bacterium]
MMDISRLCLTDLQYLLSILPGEIEKRRVLERERVIEELAALARVRGFTLEELMGGPPVRDESVKTHLAVQCKPSPVKFQHPFNGKLSWTGRGRQPKWMTAWQAEGRKIEELEVRA